jgi:carbamate kinase
LGQADGGRVIITSPEKFHDAVFGDAGTIIVKG